MPLRHQPRPGDHDSFVDLVEERAAREPERLGYAYLQDGEQDAVALTYGGLAARVRALAAELAERGSWRERVVILLPPGLDYVVAFYAVLAAGGVAVPAYPTRPGRANRALDAIIADSRPSIAIVRGGAGETTAPAPGIATLAIEDVDLARAADWRRPRLRADHLAMLQYTSGSTASPRGAMMTHATLIASSAETQLALGNTPGDVGVSWLPPYHDMGLFGSILQPMYVGFSATTMAPLAFLQRPMRWLEAISRLGATASGGPNFAYDLVVDSSRPEDRAALDLSAWRIAVSGAEPVRADTLERFATAFAPAGFRRSAFTSAYGLAEALLVSTGTPGKGSRILRVGADALAANRVELAEPSASGARSLVSNGPVIPGVTVAIVDQATARPAGDGRVGEVWATGDTVAHGYWRRPGDSRRVLRASLPGDDRSYVRTGDLGFIADGELYVTGRSKELLIIRGRNYYPVDLERSVEESHPDVRRGGVAAVSIRGANDEERLAIVAEVRRRSKADLTQILADIRNAIVSEHELRPARVVLVPEGRLPRTTSGKTQRLLIASQLETGELKAIADWQASGAQWDGSFEVAMPESPPAEAPLAQPAVQRSAASIEAWLVAHLAARLNHAPADLDHEAPFASFGLGSVEATGLAGELATWLERPLSPTLTWEYPTIARLAQYLAGGAEPVTDEFVAAPQEPIAIVGIGVRLPGAADMDEFRELLRNGRDAIREAPPERWDAAEFHDPTPATPGKIVTRNGGFIDGVEMFDPQFFGISPREARGMDPQQRVLLEVTEEALERAGIAPQQLAGTATGVFVGIGAFEYSLGPAAAGDRTVIDAYSGTGNAHSIAANRISFLYDLRGPSVALDTACSSSLVAIHLACQSLLSHESDAALAGAVNLIVAPTFSIAASQARMLSPDGLCKSFDATADGYVRSEGAGMVVLKRLSDARRDGDRILGLIRGTAVNQDGLTSGLTAPNGRAQQAVIRTALARAGIGPGDLGVIEAHGTGTPLGDPIEVNALSEVVGQATDPDQTIWLSSVKANVGHLEVASAMAGLAKVLLELQHAEVYPQIHFNELNPRIRLEGTPLRIPAKVEPWHMGLKPRFAGISSFGFGGTNAHIVVEEAREAIVPRSVVERPVHIATLSAKTEPALRELARATAAAIVVDQTVPISDVAHTLNVGRGNHLHRAAVTGATLDELAERFAAVGEGRPRQGVVVGRRAMQPPAVAFLFSGQGSQYAGMGRQLYETSPTFRAALDRCADLLDPLMDRSLLSLLFPADGEPDRLAETVYTQPALFAIEYALAALWRSWGVVPDVVLGHSVGEYVAACVAGALSLEDATRLIAARGRLMHSLPRDEGAMAAVLAPLERVEQALAGEPDVEISGANAPENITISGRRAAVERVTAALEQAGVSVVTLNVSHAFHSRLMEPILDEFDALARSVEMKPLQIALATNLDGKLLAAGATLDPGYWREHARHAVRFADDLRAAHESGAQVFVEIGPNPTLIGMGRRTLPAGGATWAASLKSGEDEWRTLLAGLGAVYCAGRDVDWRGFDADYRRQLVSLPTYPFERSRFWFELPDVISGNRGTVATADRGHPVTRAVTGSPYPTIQAKLSPESPPYLADHQVQGSVVVPGTVYVELMLDAAAGVAGGPDVPVPAIDNVEFARALFLPAGSTETAQAIVSPDGTGGRGIHVYSRPAAGDADWTLRATASLGGTVATDAPPPGLAEIEAAKERCTTVIDPGQFYPSMAKLGLVYLGAFQGIRSLARRHGEAVALIEAPESIRGDLDRYHVHPALLDAMAQVFAVAGPGSGIEDAKGLYLPVGLGRIRARRSLPARFWAHVTLNADVVAGAPTMAGTLRAIDEDGNLILQVDDWRVQMIDADARLVADEPLADWLYQVEWRPIDADADAMAEAAPADAAVAAGLAGAPAAALTEAGGPAQEAGTSAPEAAPGTWLVLDDAAGLGHRVAAEVAGRHSVRLVSPGLAFAATGDGTFALRPGSREDVESLWRAIADAGDPLPDTVVSLWALDAPRAGAAGPAARGDHAAAVVDGPTAMLGGSSPAAGAGSGSAKVHRNGESASNGARPGVSMSGNGHAAEGTRPIGEPVHDVVAASLAFAHLAQGLAAAAGDRRVRLAIVTRGASSGFAGGDETSLLQAPVNGLARVVRMEYPQFEPIVIDLDPEPAADDAGTLARVLRALPAEPEVALRGGRVLVRRLVRVPVAESPDDGDSAGGRAPGVIPVPAGNYRLESTQPGMLDRLVLRPAARRAPGAGEVEVQVAAAGVNFRDVMKALGIYPMQPGDVPWLGDEFAGRVVAVGDGADLAVGDEVFGVAPAAFGSVISTRADYVLRKPGTISFEDAATLPVVFTTALYALTHLARLQPGEKVLIHAAAGGVGQAAIQIARAIGAEIYATASEGKRDFVRSMGVEHVYDSRSLAFADEIKEATGGRGVDVVLNHLAGDFIPASISVLAPYGRFIEIGKRDIFANAKIGLWPFRNNLSFFAVDMDRLGRDKPQIYTALLREVQEGFDSGRFQPLPKTVFPIQSAVSAFRYLAQARNIGKVVLAMDVPAEAAPDDRFGLRGDATYLVTGGLRGLGARVAEWMALRGARHLVLLGRDPGSEAARETASRVEAAGAKVVMLAADMAVAEQVQAVIGQIDATLPPLRGVVHGAGILADGILATMDDRQFASVFGPKAIGALNLHHATAHLDLDFFMSFSSTSSLMGNPGQGNYAAANAFLDRLAWLRRSQGRAGQTIHWGPWSEIGMSAVAQGQRSFDFGVGTISPVRGIEALGATSEMDIAEITVMPMDWGKFISRVPTARTDPFLSVIRDGVALEAEAGPGAARVREELLAAAPEDRTGLMIAFVRTELAKVLELDPEALPLDQPLNTVGLDSLMALELKNRVEVGVGINLPIVSLIQGPTITELAAEIVGRFEAPDGTGAGPESGTPGVPAGAGAGLRDESGVPGLGGPAGREPVAATASVSGAAGPSPEEAA